MSSSLWQRQVLHLFERVHEPVYFPKSGVVYQIPDDYLTDEVKGVDMSTVLRTRTQTPEMVFKVDEQVKIPDLRAVQSIPRGKPYSTFIPSHREAANALIKIFNSYKSVHELCDAATLIRDQVNEHIFVFAWAATIIRRPDTRSLRVPPIWEVFPDKFIERQLICAAQTEAQQAPTNRTTPIIINKNFTATDRIPENKLAYFREDLGINSHHWHWHLVYPIEGTTRRDRRGELFYYMHQQIVARYDVERIVNGLARVTPLHNWEEPIVEAYFPKLTTSNGGILWGSRPSGLVLKDINIPDEGAELGIELQINDLEHWRTRILHAIHKGSVEDVTGKTIPLDEEKGIDILGDVIEAAEWSVNKLLYGDLHNFGHVALCYIHDPDRSYLENMGVIGDAVTAMRDPVFYRWHKFTDSLFQQFKATLQPYTPEKLTIADVTIDHIEVRSKGTSESGSTHTKNVIVTGWQESELELTRGLDFSSSLPVNARVTHLQHENFNYYIQVNNSSKAAKEVVFRIFLAPVKDETGRTFSFREQRHLMIEMDKFVVTIRPGKSLVKRMSSESSVTIPFEKTFRDLERAEAGPPLAPGGTPVVVPTDSNRNFCGCGWPDHFLVPRGTAKPGTAFSLFVMATDWTEDRVATDREASKKVCRDAASYCGVLDDKYPDKKPMGYPFDRPPDKDIRTLSQFLTPNMATAEIRIQFEDRIIKRYP